uniref:[histone H3]-lysine(4) N-trimethyltransferase n=1 Tax=Syphacia muris TaxID=451379 RepID=A0A0N5ABG0_9BILA
MDNSKDASKTESSQLTAVFDGASRNSKNALIEATKPKVVRKRRVRNELALLLPPPVNVTNDLTLFSWSSTKSTKTWRRRDEVEEDGIMWQFMKDGLDKEDLDFLEKMFHILQSSGMAKWNRTLYWVPPRPISPVKILERPRRNGRVENFFDDSDLCGIVPHASGCARAEGFYKLSHKQKRGVIRRPDLFTDGNEVNEKEENVVRLQTQAARDARTMNRRLLYSMKDTSSDIFKVNQLKYRKKMIKFARSRIHGWGLYALEPIAPDDMIVEYVGQKIRPTVADERERAYERRGMGSSYLFRIDNDTVIDATQMGNFARFINHSCQPNCYAKVVTVEGDKRIVIYSKVQINKGDEITYDYKFPIEDEKIDCLCGAPTCRGSLN